MVSTRAHAHLVDMDASEALHMKGVVDFISYKDVPAKNNYVLLYNLDNEDETVFAKDTVHCLVGIIQRLLLDMATLLKYTLWSIKSAPF